MVEEKKAFKTTANFSVDMQILLNFLEICEDNKIDKNKIVNDYLKSIVDSKKAVNDLVARYGEK